MGTKDLYFSWLDFILDKPRIPQTISTSYGINENRCSRGYVVQACNLFAQLGVRGVSVLFSSGDNGVGEGNCVTDGMVQFVPLFPATYTCGVFLQLGVVHKCGSRTLTTSLRFGRSLGHRHRRNDGLRAGDCSGFLRRRLLGLLSARPSYQEQAMSPGGPPSSGSSATSIKAFTSAFASVTCSNLFVSYLVLGTALLAAPSPTLPPRLPVSWFSSMAMENWWTTQAVRRLCVSPSSLLSESSILEHPTDCQFTGCGGHNLAA